MAAVDMGDVLATALLLGAVAAFGVGSVTLARADDLHAIYWLVLGAVGLRAATQLARSGRGAA